MNLYNSSNPNFIVESLIGSGTFGQVYKVFDQNSSKHYAIKRTMKKGCKVSREFKVLQEVRDCDHCVHLIDIFYTLKQKDLIQNLVFEYFPQSLGQLIRNNYKKRRFEYSEIYCIMKQILMGLSYIHSKNIIHRDIKPDNILITEDFPYHVKLCDFGSAKKVCDKNTPYIVSRYYRAPELIFCAEKYDVKIDIWSAGCIFLELFTGFPVFRGNNDGEQFVKIADIIGPPSKEDVAALANVRITPRARAKIIAIGKKHDLKELFSDHSHPEMIESLINGMLEWNPHKRFSASQCLNHDYFIAGC